MVVTQSASPFSPDGETLKALGFDPTLTRKLAAGIEAGLLRDLHVVLAARSHQVFLEYYTAGPDENWGAALGDVAFDADTLHDLRSVTKSIVSLLYGIALDKGLVPPPHAPLFEQFPEYDDLAKDAARSKITIDHALTMTLGMEWDENRPYTDPQNSEIAMENAPDRYRFVLERPLVAEPGTRWIYSGGSVALVGAIIERGSGKRLPDFAREVLFEPLNIAKFHWTAGHDGVASAASGLRLTAPDLLKIGMLLLQKGRWNGERVVSEDWIVQSFSPVISTEDGLGYGRLWFCGDAPAPALSDPCPWYAGFGNGGQRLWLMPDADIAAVVYSGKYNSWDAWITPTRVWREIILANFLRA
ncbi:MULTISPECIES: serine hydrolase domain-containing protein [Rhizobium]|uniref:CubicO group peptidase, beta-lactamase class C family n=1 Tax=Rhizobium miluonense TaxID=411945 RepID=A0A1C3US66_9HYPH|nr:serine hydrolase [Rhizobium miluonense]SCB18312.1 CubicO group peptidase, beta-lactamase class C family [Rhizobium miluonense]